MADTTTGHVFWAATFSYGVIFPLSLFRKISALRFASLFSFFCGTYVVLVLVMICLFDREVTPDLGGSLEEAATTMNMTAFSLFNSFPLIVFSFMYQPNLPAVYQELRQKSTTNMMKVVLYATTIACTCYVMAGYFGYATFSLYPDVKQIMEQENIFLADYRNNGWMLAAKILLLAGVILASPLCVLPSKDTVEEVLLGQDRVFTSKENFLCTFCLVSACFLLAVFIPQISDAMTVIGSTSNPLVGFSLPIIFYLKMDTIRGNANACSPKRLIAHAVNIICICNGILSLVLFIDSKVNAEEE